MRGFFVGLLDHGRERLFTQLFRVFGSTLDKKLRVRGHRLAVAFEPLRDQFSHFTSTDSQDRELQSNWCVIFHGKVYDDACLEYLQKSIELCRQDLPKITIILSTYNDKYFLKLKSFCTKHNILLTESPDAGPLPHPFPRSLCQQIQSIHSALTLSQSLGLAKSVKIRVDQRANVQAGIMLYDLLEHLIPRKSNTTRGRILGTTYNSYLHRPLGLSDMMHFGYTKDLLLYWEAISIEEWLSLYPDLCDRFPDPLWSQFVNPETWLAARYLLKLGIDLTNPERANMFFWNSVAGVLNANAVQQEWFKTFSWIRSNFHSLNWFGSVFGPNYSELSFESWVLNYIDIRQLSRFDNPILRRI